MRPQGNVRIQKFDANGGFLTTWGSRGSGDGQFMGVQAVATDGAGHVYATDSVNRIQKFDANGTFIAKWGSFGTANGQFSGPSGVAVDAAGHVYVADQNNSRIQKFACP